MQETRDVFLCHASEDKETVVHPLFQALDGADISCWFDEADIRWGESITQAVNRGLAGSRYVIVVLSHAFLSKHWPQREVNAVVNQEAFTGEVRVLPLVVGDAHDEVFSAYPLLNDKRYLTWSGDPAPIVAELRRLLPMGNPSAAQVVVAPMEPSPEIPMPRSVQMPTERDKNQFVSTAYQEIKSYFQKAVVQLSEKVTGIEADFTEITNLSFICSFYKDGQCARQCKIWLGPHFSSTQSILYCSDRSIDPHQTNSINECLSVSDRSEQLALSTLLNMNGNKENLTPLDAATYLWERTIEWF